MDGAGVWLGVAWSTMACARLGGVGEGAHGRRALRAVATRRGGIVESVASSESPSHRRSRRWVSGDQEADRVHRSRKVGGENSAARAVRPQASASSRLLNLEGFKQISMHPDLRLVLCSSAARTQCNTERYHGMMRRSTINERKTTQARPWHCLPAGPSLSPSMKRPRLSFSPEGGSPLILSSTGFDNRKGVMGVRITVSGLAAVYLRLGDSDDRPFRGSEHSLFSSEDEPVQFPLLRQVAFEAAAESRHNLGHHVPFDDWLDVGQCDKRWADRQRRAPVIPW